MLERTNVITNELLEPITFVLAYPTVYSFPRGKGEEVRFVVIQHDMKFHNTMS